MFPYKKIYCFKYALNSLFLGSLVSENLLKALDTLNLCLLALSKP